MALIDDILADIARREHQRLERAHELSISLLAGDLGSVMYLYEYSKLDSSYQPIGDKMLDRILYRLKYKSSVQTYCNGVAGLIMGLSALQEQGFIDDFSSLLDDVDHYLDSSLDIMLQYNNHDFLHGFIGLGFYSDLTGSNNSTNEKNDGDNPNASHVCTIGQDCPSVMDTCQCTHLCNETLSANELCCEVSENIETKCCINPPVSVENCEVSKEIVCPITSDCPETQVCVTIDC